MANVPTTFDEYLAALKPDRRAALERVRKIVNSAAPGAEEVISYRQPAFRIEGRILLALGAAARHCALYPWSESVTTEFKDELNAFSTSKGTIRFQPTHPLPAALLRRIVKARIAAIRTRAGRRV